MTEMKGVSITILLIICLLAGHMAIKEYFPSPLFWGIGFLVPFILLCIVLIIKRMEFSFLLIIYILNHFVYAENQGGLWCLMTFAVLVTYFFIFKKDLDPSFFSEGTYMKWLFAILVCMQILGVFTNNPMPLLNRLQGTATFLSYILMYFFVSRQIITRGRLQRFFWACLIISGYMLIVCINQRYAFFYFDTPLFPLVINQPGYTSMHAYGTIGSGPLLGEYALGLITIFGSFLLFIDSAWDAGIRLLWLLLLLIICYLILVLTNSRSTFMLLFVMAFVYLIIQVVLSRKISLAVIAVTFSMIMISIVADSFFGLDTLYERFYQSNLYAISIRGILTGEDINRFNVFPLIMDRLVNESWIIGHGYGTYDSNTMAWFGTLDTLVTDPHSLYFALPMIFGWLGAAAFILVVVTIFFRLLRSLRKDSNVKVPLYLQATMIGLVVFWPLFLIDQYKVNMLAKINYQAIIWIWLGLSSAIVRASNCKPRLEEYEQLS